MVIGYYTWWMGSLMMNRQLIAFGPANCAGLIFCAGFWPAFFITAVLPAVVPPASGPRIALEFGPDVLYGPGNLGA